jgi:hypothetical protein
MYSFIFCHCSLFLHPTILLIPIFISILLNILCSNLSFPLLVSFTPQYVISPFLFAAYGADPLFIVSHNPLQYPNSDFPPYCSSCGFIYTSFCVYLLPVVLKLIFFCNCHILPCFINKSFTYPYPDIYIFGND